MATIPSIKKLSLIKDADTVLARKVLECRDYTDLAKLRLDFYEFNSVDQWISKCYNPPSFHTVKMAMLDKALGTFGVEYIAKGHNVKSPAIEYCNAGDTYATTVLYVNGNYRVGCWGDIVERGNYD